MKKISIYFFVFLAMLNLSSAFPNDYKYSNPVDRATDCNLMEKLEAIPKIIGFKAGNPNSTDGYNSQFYLGQILLLWLQAGSVKEFIREVSEQVHNKSVLKALNEIISYLEDNIRDVSLNVPGGAAYWNEKLREITGVHFRHIHSSLRSLTKSVCEAKIPESFNDWPKLEDSR